MFTEKKPATGSMNSFHFYSFIVTANVLRIGDGGAFEKRQPNICINAQ